MSPSRAIVVDTLARHLAERFSLHVTCVPCWRTAQLDLAALAARAPDATLDDLRPRLRCRVCGSGRVQLTRIPYTPATGRFGPTVGPACDPT